MKTDIHFAQIDWPNIRTALDDNAYAVTSPFIPASACDRIRKYYGSARFRSTIDMARYNFGNGEYKYFDYPLPDDVQMMREVFYERLAPIANHWAKLLGMDAAWPEELHTLTRRCHDEGQCRPTPLMLRYEAGDYNCLHQDLYGPIHFPLQVILMLSKPGEDFEGGELLLVEQRPRMQSRPILVHLQQGAAAIIPVRERPRRGVRGYHRAGVRHGVGEVLAGQRQTLGLIFHDAK